MSIVDELSNILGNAFAQEGLPADLGTVRVSDRPDLAQFQCNGAMAAAKIAKQNPREVAEKIKQNLETNHAGIFEKIEIAGPGFINFNLKDDFIAQNLNTLSAEKNLGIPDPEKKQTIILDYGGPNVAKPMHVGHLRSAIIGDTLRRIILTAGHEAIGDIHLGDWGTQMGQIISELELRSPDWPYFGADNTGPFPPESPVTIEDLAEIYPAASAACKENEQRRALALKATLDLQKGRPGYLALWQHFMTVSIAAIKANYESLDVHFDLWKGEADAHPYIAPMIKDLKEKGLTEESDGALIMRVAEEDDKKEIPPLILYKSDGAVMYGTTDLATIVERMQEYSPDEIIYVADKRQSLHFEQVFRAARKADITTDTTNLTFSGFGTMNGTDGKPFKTRAGGVMKLEDLIQNAIDKAKERLSEANLAQDAAKDELEDIAHKVAIAAIKFADLQNSRSSDYIFDLDRMTAFEGKTGPYLLYQAVRIRSLLNKAKQSGLDDGSVTILDDSDRPLALLLLEFPDHFTAAIKGHTPHILCDFVYKLAQTFSSFYGSCHILSETNEEIRKSRLTLCKYTANHIAFILDLLGMKIPNRM